MISTMVRVSVEKDGTVKLPPDWWRELGVELPHEVELLVMVPAKKIKRVPRKLNAKERAKFDRALELLRSSMQDVDRAEALKHIREGRRDRWF